jgi:hypothetical protein
MEKIPIWKRVGGWLRRSQVKMEGDEVERLDPESLVLNQDEEKEGGSSLLHARINKKDRPLAAMEEGFNRLVEVLESLNHNVVQQREQGAEISSRLMEVVDLTKVVPDAIQTQTQLAKSMNDSISEQTIHSQQLVELIKNLPDLSRDQLEKLGDISDQLESSTQSELKMAQSFNRVDLSVQDMAEHSKAQSISLKNIGEVIVQGDEKLTTLLAKQNKRFAWMFGVILILSLAAIAGVILLFLAKSNVS